MSNIQGDEIRGRLSAGRYTTGGALAVPAWTLETLNESSANAVALAYGGETLRQGEHEFHTTLPQAQIPIAHAEVELGAELDAWGREVSRIVFRLVRAPALGYFALASSSEEFASSLKSAAEMESRERRGMTLDLRVRRMATRSGMQVMYAWPIARVGVGETCGTGFGLIA
ncbi:hypothetical protein [Streptomyces iconiensis]|uniref:Uncharacterized protein n=1 Tax=Streptomyces iconiensis TaxID=1384038 RepID=A0ABT7A4S2_9ACTN|nr:hypothetical protein [Streptomyces iconiensis]MDJ1136291.1 hypothetical protein [Streptomyces iconiensis]